MAELKLFCRCTALVKLLWCGIALPLHGIYARSFVICIQMMNLSDSCLIASSFRGSTPTATAPGYIEIYLSGFYFSIPLWHFLGALFAGFPGTGRLWRAVPRKSINAAFQIFMAFYSHISWRVYWQGSDVTAFFRGTLFRVHLEFVHLPGHRSPAAPCTAVIHKHCLPGIYGRVQTNFQRLPWHLCSVFKTGFRWLLWHLCADLKWSC